MANVAKELGILIAAKDEASGPLKATKEGIEGVQTAAKAPGLAKMGDNFRKLRESLVDPVKLKAIQTEMARIQAEAAKGPDATRMKQLRAEVDKLETSYKQVTSSGAKSFQGGLFDIAQGISPVQLGLVGITTAAAGLAVRMGTDAVKAAASFEHQMSAVQAVSGVSKEELAKLAQRALDLGPAWGQSATGVAKGMEELSKAGISTKDIMEGAAQGAMTLAVAGGTELAPAAAIAANAIKNFNLTGRDMAHVADMIAGGANATTADVNDFALAFSQCSAAMSLANQTFDDTTVAIAMMADAGIKGSDAGTSLKTMFLSLSPTSKKATEEMEQLGIITDEAGNRFYDAQGTAKSYRDIAEILSVAMKDLSDEQKTASLQVIFGSDAYRAAAISAKAGAEGVDKMWEVMSKTSAADAARTRMDNFTGSVDKLGAQWDRFNIQVGGGTLPGLRDLTDAAGAALEGVNAMTPRVQELTKGGMELSAAILVAVVEMADFREQIQPIPAEAGAMASAMRDLSVELLVQQGIAAQKPLGSYLDSVKQATVAVKKLTDEEKERAAKWKADRAEIDALISTGTYRAIDDHQQALERMDREKAVKDKAADEETKRAEKWKKDRAEIDAILATGSNWAVDDHEETLARMDREEKVREKAASDREREKNKAISDTKRLADEALREADRIAEKARDTTWEIGALGRKMVNEVGDALSKETDLWEAYGNRWIEKWGDVDAAIRKTYEDRERALAGITESEAISKDRDARKRELNDRINGEKKVFDLRMDDVEFHHREELSTAKALRDYQEVLNSSASQEEKNNAWEIYQERLADLVQEHQAFDAEVQWRLSQEKIRAEQEAVWAQAQAALEKTLHEEELARQRAAIDARQQAEEARINAEWDAWQKAEESKTAKSAAEAKERAQANLEAWRDEFIDKLAKESEPGVEKFIGMVAGKWADALAGIAGATAAGAGGGGGENWNATEEARHKPGGDIFETWRVNEPEQYEAWRQEHGMQHGGSFVVPGSGGPDSRVVAFPASPGERVTVTPAGGAAGVTQVINLQGNYVGFDRSSLEELARQLKPYLDSLVRL